MKHLASCWLLICFHGNFRWFNISPVFLVQSPSGVIFDKVCCPPHCGMLVSSGGPAVVGWWWLLDQMDPLGKAHQEEVLLWLVFDVCLGHGTGWQGTRGICHLRSAVIVLVLGCSHAKFRHLLGGALTWRLASEVVHHRHLLTLKFSTVCL